MTLRNPSAGRGRASRHPNPKPRKEDKRSGSRFPLSPSRDKLSRLLPTLAISSPGGVRYNTAVSFSGALDARLLALFCMNFYHCQNRLVYCSGCLPVVSPRVHRAPLLPHPGANQSPSRPVPLTLPLTQRSSRKYSSAWTEDVQVSLQMQGLMGISFAIVLSCQVFFLDRNFHSIYEYLILVRLKPEPLRLPADIMWVSRF